MSNISIPLTAWIPIRKPIIDREQRIDGYICAREKLLRQLSTVLSVIDGRISVVAASIDMPPGNILKWLMSETPFATDFYVEYIHLGIVVSLNAGQLRSQNKGQEIEEGLFPAFAGVMALGPLELALMLSELAFPGAVSTLKGILVATLGGDFLHSIKAKAAFQSLKYPEKGEPIWPDLKDIDLDNVVTWALGTSIKDKALGKTRVERALAAYTHIIGLTHLRQGEVLFRAMQGLEAFYCDGIGDLRKQLSEKSALWLGRWSDRRNIVGHLYDVRSAFVHGSASIEYKLNQSDPWEEDEKLMNGFAYGVGFSVRLLVATLQHCIERSVYDVRWSYSVEEC